MSAPTEQNKNQTENAPESPTTARPLDLDDDDVQDNNTVGDEGTATNTSATTQPARDLTQAPPPKPPRPVSETQQNIVILKEAFPSVDEAVIKAVLSASGGRVEPAFNALLEMTDPDAAKREPVEEAPPPQPPRPQGRRELSQLEADELYARQLAEQYDNVGAYERRTSNHARGNRPAQNTHEEDREYNFMEDDLPVIRENLRKGFLETQTKVNGWITGFRKKLEEQFDESNDGPEGPPQPLRRQGEPSRRSGDYDRYDADPQVLGDDFANIRLNADGSARHSGPNPGVYRPPPASSPRPSDGRRVGFKEETEEINMYESSPKVPPKDSTPGSGGKASKWQPLSSVDPSPITDNDPFSLGDSEDEKDIKDKPKDAKLDENERLKQAAAEAMADSLVDKPQEKDAAAKKG